MPIDYFVDETFHAPSNPGAANFYVFALVGLERANLRKYRVKLTSLVARSKWHSSEMLSKQSGRNKFKQTVHHFSQVAHHIIFVVDQIPESDRTGEQTRKHMITVIVRYILVQNPSSFIIFEKRDSLGQKRLDNETIRGNLSELQQSRVRFLTPVDEVLLWLPDLLASAYRHHLTGKTNDLIEMYLKKPEVVRF